MKRTLPITLVACLLFISQALSASELKKARERDSEKQGVPRTFKKAYAFFQRAGFKAPEFAGFRASSDPDVEGWFIYKLRHKADGTRMSLNQRLLRPRNQNSAIKGDPPNGGYQVAVSHREKHRTALRKLVQKMSPELAKAISEQIVEYDRTKKSTSRHEEGVRILTNKDGITLEILPGENRGSSANP